jgi:hypothetical protein
VEIGSSAERLVHQQDLRPVRDRTCEAQPLLLSAGQDGCRFVEAVGHLLPQVRRPQRLLDERVEVRPVVAAALQDESGDDVPADGHRRERVGALETMPTVRRIRIGSTPGA